MPIYIKYIITAALVVLTAEITNRNVKLGALIGALPVMMIIVILWMFVEDKSSDGVSKIATFVHSTFWYVLPTLPMLLVMDKMLKKGNGFWLSIGVYVLGTIALFFILNLVLKRFSINLM